MTEPSSWGALYKWLATLAKQWLPDRLLRWRWPSQRLLNTIQVFHYSQAPHFYVQAEREPRELQYVGFNLFNFSPFKLAIVGADLRITVDIDGQEWLKYSQRLPAEIPIPPYGPSGFHFSLPLSESQATRLREHPDSWTRIRVSGHMILKSTFGELRKEIHADVVALISR